jgi:hypothetical protein
MTRFLHHLRSNLVAYLALFVALGGTSYAAFRIPAGSVGSRQLKNHSISPIKFARSQIAGYVRDWATIDTAGHLTGSSPRAHLVGWIDQPETPVAGGLVSWGQPIPTSCFALATTASSAPGASAVTAEIFRNDGKSGPYVGAKILLSVPQTAVNVAVICRQP